MDTNSDVFNKLDDVVKKAKRLGADEVEVSLVRSEGLSASVRLGNPEHLDDSSSNSFSVKVHIGKKSGTSSAHSLRPESMEDALKKAIKKAKASTDNPYSGVADPAQIASSYPCPDIYDASKPSDEQLFDRAKEVEDAARSHPEISNAHGAGASWGRETVFLLISNGFSGSYQGSMSSVSVSVIATQGDQAESGFAHDSAVYDCDLKDPAEIGDEAAREVIERLGARRMKSGEVTVVFDPYMSRKLVGEFLAAINGNSVAKDTTFLKKAMMNTQIFNEAVSIIDNPLMNRGLASRPFDGDGIKAQETKFVENGILKSWMLGLESARQLGLQTTGHNSVGVNLCLSGGELSQEELMADIKNGFYVTGLMGHGGNTLTGDYSQGASGLWIENGKKSFAVNEVAIVGNLLDMFGRAIPANDAGDKRKSSIVVPSLRVDGMMLAGL